MFGVFFLLFLSTVELVGMLDQSLKLVLFRLHLLRGGRLVIVRDHHAEHCIACLHVYFGLRTSTRVSAGTKTMSDRRVFGSGYFMCDCQTHHFRWRKILWSICRHPEQQIRRGQDD